MNNTYNMYQVKRVERDTERTTECNCASKNPYSPDEVKLSPPYVTFYNALEAMFSGDEAYHLSPLDDATKSCTLTTDNRMKYILLKENLKTEFPEFGESGLTINLEYVGRDGMDANELAAIFSTNPHFSYLFESKGGPFPFASCVFKNEVIQYHNDNLFDPHSYKSDLAENIVKGLFKTRCFVSTDIKSE